MCGIQILFEAGHVVKSGAKNSEHIYQQKTNANCCHLCENFQVHLIIVARNIQKNPSSEIWSALWDFRVEVCVSGYVSSVKHKL